MGKKLITNDFNNYASKYRAFMFKNELESFAFFSGENIFFAILRM